MRQQNRPRRQKQLLITVTLAAAAGLGLLAFHIVGTIQEPQRVQEEMTLVEDVFGPVPDDANECVLKLEIALAGSDGCLAIRTPAGWEQRKASWPHRRPPDALCEMRSMKWKGEFLGEFGIAKWTAEQLRYRYLWERKRGKEPKVVLFRWSRSFLSLCSSLNLQTEKT